MMRMRNAKGTLRGSLEAVGLDDEQTELVLELLQRKEVEDGKQEVEDGKQLGRQLEKAAEWLLRQCMQDDEQTELNRVKDRILKTF